MSNNMETQKISLDLGGRTAVVTVGRATARMGIRRSMAIFKAFEDKENAEKEGKPVDQEAFVISYRTLPDLMSGTVSAEGIELPISAEDVLDMPEEEVNKWLEAVYSLNPHWNVKTKADKEEADKEDVKKAKS